jgi:hypothetical protein
MPGAPSIAQLKKDLANKKAAQESVLPKFEQDVKHLEKEAARIKSELAKAEAKRKLMVDESQSDINEVQKEIDREASDRVRFSVDYRLIMFKVEKDRRNWKYWTDTEVISRFENGDFDYAQIPGNTIVAKRISQAYKACKPELEAPSVQAITKAAKSITTLNTAGGPGKGFWALHYVDRGCKILSDEEPATTSSLTNGVQEHSKPSGTPTPTDTQQEKPKETVERGRTPSQAPSEMSRSRRSPSTPDLKRELTEPSETVADNDSTPPPEKKQRVE